MKKMIYIVALSLGVGLSQCVSAGEMVMHNNVIKVTLDDEVIYKFMFKFTTHGMMTGLAQVGSNRMGIYTGSAYLVEESASRGSLLRCTSEPFSPEQARVMFEELYRKFHNIPTRYFLLPTV